MRHEVVFVVGVSWLAVQLLVIVVSVARARTAYERLVAHRRRRARAGRPARPGRGPGRPVLRAGRGARAGVLAFVSTLAAGRYLGDRRPFEQPERPEAGP